MGFYDNKLLYKKSFGFMVNPYSNFMKMSGRMHSIISTEVGYRFKYHRRGALVESIFSFEPSFGFRLCGNYSQPLLRSFNPAYSDHITDFYLMYVQTPGALSNFKLEKDDYAELCPLGLIPRRKTLGCERKSLTFMYRQEEYSLFFFLRGDKIVDVDLPYIITDRYYLVQICAKFNGLLVHEVEDGGYEHPTSGKIYEVGPESVGYELVLAGDAILRDDQKNVTFDLKKAVTIRINGELKDISNYAVKVTKTKVIAYTYHVKFDGDYVLITGNHLYFGVPMVKIRDKIVAFAPAVHGSLFPSMALIEWYDGLRTYSSGNFFNTNGRKVFLATREKTADVVGNSVNATPVDTPTPMRKVSGWVTEVDQNGKVNNFQVEFDDKPGIFNEGTIRRHIKSIFHEGRSTLEQVLAIMVPRNMRADVIKRLFLNLVSTGEIIAEDLLLDEEDLSKKYFILKPRVG